MIEELKLIAEIFNQASDTALYAFLAFGFFQLAKSALFLFPILAFLKFAVTKAFKE